MLMLITRCKKELAECDKQNSYKEKHKELFSGYWTKK